MPTTVNLDPTNVSVGKPAVSGQVFRAAKGTALPNDATTTLPSTFKSLGYISEDGVTDTINRNSTDFKEWGGSVVSSAQDEYSEEFKMKFIEVMNIEVLKTVFGDSNVSGTLSTGITVRKNATELSEAVYVIETIMQNGAFKRVVIPRGKLGALGDINYKANELLGFEATIKALADDSGQSSYEYIKTPSAQS